MSRELHPQTETRPRSPSPGCLGALLIGDTDGIGKVRGCRHPRLSLGTSVLTSGSGDRRKFLVNPGRLFILAPPLNSEWHRSPRYLRPHGRVERVGAGRTRSRGWVGLAHCTAATPLPPPPAGPSRPGRGQGTVGKACSQAWGFFLR